MFTQSAQARSVLVNAERDFSPAVVEPVTSVRVKFPHGVSAIFDRNFDKWSAAGQ
jgi:hypothetical protein